MEETLDVPEDYDEAVVPTREWVGDIVEALDWRRGAFGFRLPHHEHVNLSEYRALRVAVRRLIREGSHSARVVICTDSNVVLGATAKGRSRSRRLRRLQQAMAAEMLFFNLYVGVLPVGTVDNPADDPSRNMRVRLPAEEPQAWATAFLAGRLEAIDPRRGYAR